jgi:meiotic recombination protein REC8
MGMEVDGRENDVDHVVTERPAPSGEGPWASRKAKRVRVRLDTRTELTDDELKVLFGSFTQGSVIHSNKAARAQYVEDQEALRRELEEKRLEKEGARLISQMLYGVPPICK